MGAKKRKRETPSDSEQPKKGKLYISDPIALIVATSQFIPSWTENFLLTYLNTADVLAICRGSSSIAKFVSDPKRKTRFPFTWEQMNGTGSISLISRYLTPIESKKDLRLYAQKACTNGHHVILKALLKNFGLMPMFKSYRLVGKAWGSHKCMELLLQWRGPNDEYVHITSKQLDRFFSSFFLPRDVPCLKMMLERFPTYEIPRFDQVRYALDCVHISVLEVLISSRRFYVSPNDFSTAALSIDVRPLRLMLAHNVVPIDDRVREHFAFAVANGRDKIVAVFLADGRFDPNVLYCSLSNPICGVEIARMVLADERFDIFHRQILLHIACIWDWTDIVSLIIKNKQVDVNILIEGQSALVRAARYANVKILKMLLDRVETSQWIIDSALNHAIDRDSLDMVQLLIHYNELPLNSHLGRACVQFRPNLPIIRFLATQPNVDLSNADNCLAKFACKCGDIDLLKFVFVKATFNPSSSALLKIALDNGHTDLAEFLVHDSLVDPTYNNHMFLRHLLENGMTDRVKRLLQHPKVKESLAL